MENRKFRKSRNRKKWAEILWLIFAQKNKNLDEKSKKMQKKKQKKREKTGKSGQIVINPSLDKSSMAKKRI